LTYIDVIASVAQYFYMQLWTPSSLQYRK